MNPLQSKGRNIINFSMSTLNYVVPVDSTRALLHPDKPIQQSFHKKKESCLAFHKSSLADERRRKSQSSAFSFSRRLMDPPDRQTPRTHLALLPCVLVQSLLQAPQELKGGKHSKSIRHCVCGIPWFTDGWKLSLLCRGQQVLAFENFLFVVHQARGFAVSATHC